MNTIISLLIGGLSVFTLIAIVTGVLVDLVVGFVYGVCVWIWKMRNKNE